MRYFFLTLFIFFSFLTEASSNEHLSGKININTAGVDDFERLPFVGKKKAESIVQFRKKNGLFKKPEEIIVVPGIGKKLYHSLKHFITTAGDTTLLLESEKDKGGKIIYANSFSGNLFPLENHKYVNVLTRKIREAKKSIFLCMFLFKTGSDPKNSANQVLDELILAAKKGVEINILLEKNSWSDDSVSRSNEITATKLREAGISVFFDNNDVTTHAKLFIIDELIVFIGSHNLTDSALKSNNETSLMVESKEMAAYFLSYVKDITKHEAN